MRALTLPGDFGAPQAEAGELLTRTPVRRRTASQRGTPLGRGPDPRSHRLQGGPVKVQWDHLRVLREKRGYRKIPRKGEKDKGLKWCSNYLITRRGPKPHLAQGEETLGLESRAPAAAWLNVFERGSR